MCISVVLVYVCLLVVDMLVLCKKVHLTQNWTRDSANERVCVRFNPPVSIVRHAVSSFFPPEVFILY